MVTDHTFSRLAQQVLATVLIHPKWLEYRAVTPKAGVLFMEGSTRATRLSSAGCSRVHKAELLRGGTMLSLH